MLPHAEIKTAGVIIAVSTATAEEVGSNFYMNSLFPRERVGERVNDAQTLPLIPLPNGKGKQESYRPRLVLRFTGGLVGVVGVVVFGSNHLRLHLFLHQVNDHLLREVSIKQNFITFCGDRHALQHRPPHLVFYGPVAYRSSPKYRLAKILAVSGLSALLTPRSMKFVASMLTAA